MGPLEAQGDDDGVASGRSSSAVAVCWPDLAVEWKAIRVEMLVTGEEEEGGE